MSEVDETAEAAPPKRSKKKLLATFAVLVVLLGGGAGAWYLMSGTPAEKAEAAPPEAPVFLALDTFTVNLMDGEQYLQLDVTLQLPDPAQMDAIKQHMPRVRSRLLSLLSSLHADELVLPEDKERLAAEIKAQIERPFYANGKPQQVKDVLFTSFVIQ